MILISTLASKGESKILRGVYKFTQCNVIRTQYVYTYDKARSDLWLYSSLKSLVLETCKCNLLWHRAEELSLAIGPV